MIFFSLSDEEKKTKWRVRRRRRGRARARRVDIASSSSSWRRPSIVGNGADRRPVSPTAAARRQNVLTFDWATVARDRVVRDRKPARAPRAVRLGVRLGPARVAYVSSTVTASWSSVTREIAPGVRVNTVWGVGGGTGNGTERLFVWFFFFFFFPRSETYRFFFYTFETGIRNVHFHQNNACIDFANS